MKVSKDNGKVHNQTLSLADMEKSYRDPNREPTENRRNLAVSEDNLSASSSQKNLHKYKKTHSKFSNNLLHKLDKSKKAKLHSGIEE